jgi:guanylate kinase
MFHNKLIIITAPSGAGKTSITQYLLEKYPQLSFSISAATRSPRANEVNNVDYYFISLDSFKQHIHQNDFIEYEMVYEGKYYGTLKNELERIWNKGQLPILDIDVKGAIHIQSLDTYNTLSIFVEPPTIEDLKIRLDARNTETEESLKARLNKAAYEISFKHQFNKVILNASLNLACKEAEEVVLEFMNSN